MKEEYITDFGNPFQWTNTITDKSLNYPFVINPSAKIDIDLVARALTKDFSEFIENTDLLPGMCFLIAREVSYVMIELEIKHAITIGDIQLSDRTFVGLSHASLERELEKGYQIKFNELGKPCAAPANAHSWITLEDGQIIDATILASLHRKSGKSGKLTFEEAFYRFGKAGAPAMKHVPYMTGFAYHYLVLYHPFDKMGQTYREWFKTYYGFMDFMSNN